MRTKLLLLTALMCVVGLAKAQTTYNGHEYVDLGLPSGVLWATYNVGATTPEGYGGYFAWGETTTKTDYRASTYSFYDAGNYTEYNKIDGKTTLEPTHDAATQNWGGRWRMPTQTEMTELKNQCTWTWVADYNSTGVAGFEVRGKKEGFTDKFIFLPAAGYYLNTDPQYLGERIYYLTSSHLTIRYDWCSCGFLSFEDHSTSISEDLSRYYGCSARPVYNEIKTYEVGDAESFIEKMKVNSDYGDTIRLTADIEVNDYVSCYGTKVLDLNGHNITQTGSYKIYVYKKLTINGNENDMISHTVECTGTLHLKGGIIYDLHSGTNSNTIIDGGQISDTYSAYYGNNLTVNGGTFNGIFITDVKNVLITGGTFHADKLNKKSLYPNGSHPISLTINGGEFEKVKFGSNWDVRVAGGTFKPYEGSVFEKISGEWWVDKNDFAPGSRYTYGGNEISHKEFLALFDGEITETITVTPQNYTLTTATNNAAYGTVTEGGTYSNTELVTIKATPAAGCEFVQWSDGSTEAKRSLYVEADTELTAYFYNSSMTSAITTNPNPIDLGNMKENATKNLNVEIVGTNLKDSISWTISGGFTIGGETSGKIFLTGETVNISFTANEERGPVSGVLTLTSGTTTENFQISATVGDPDIETDLEKVELGEVIVEEKATADLEITGINLAEAISWTFKNQEFTINENTSGALAAAGETVTISFTAGEELGEVNDTLILTSGEVTLKVPVTATVVPKPAIVANLAAVDLGEVIVGDSATAQLEITGINLPANITWTLRGGFTIGGKTTGELAAAGETITIAFTAGEELGQVNDTLTLVSGEVTLQVPITATIVPVPAIHANPTAIDLGEVIVGDSATAQLEITGINLPANITWRLSNGFTIDGKTTGEFAAAGENITIAFTAGEELGEVNDTLSLVSGEVTLNVPITATIVPVPAIHANPTAIDLGEVIVGDSATAQIEITGINLPANITWTLRGGFTIDGKTTGELAAAGETVTISFTAGEALGEVNDTLSLVSGEVTLQVPVTATVIEKPGSGIANHWADQVTVYTHNRILTVKSTGKQAIAVYNIMGQLVATKRNPRNVETFVLPAAGVYVVKVGTGSAKVVAQ